MELLLDTHAFIWFIDVDNSLPEKAADAIGPRPDAKAYRPLSKCSGWYRRPNRG